MLVFKSESGQCPMSLQSRSTFCNPVDCSPPGSSFQEDSPGKNTGVGWHALLQGIFPNEGSNLHLLCLPHWQAGFLGCFLFCFVLFCLPLAPPGKSQMGEAQVNKCSPRGTVQNKWCRFPDTSKMWGRWRYAKATLMDLWLFFPTT